VRGNQIRLARPPKSTGYYKFSNFFYGFEMQLSILHSGQASLNFVLS